MGAKVGKGKAAKWLKPERLKQIEQWAISGVTLEDIAHNMGICRTTLYSWSKKYPEINEALERGEVADIIAVSKLYQRAIGMTLKETTTETDADGNERKKETIKEIPPDVTALIYWTKNRMPDKWSNANGNADEQRIKLEKLRLENEKLKAEITMIKGEAELETDDGFIKALDGSAAADWQDYNDADEIQNEKTTIGFKLTKNEQ